MKTERSLFSPVLLLLTLTLVAGPLLPVAAQGSGGTVPLKKIYSKTPSYETSFGSFSSGIVLIDLNKDGYDDMVLANGSDVTPQPLSIYYNQLASRRGTLFGQWPDRYSSKIGYNVAVASGDIDQDGWLDLVVLEAYSLKHAAGSGGFTVFRNDGHGSLVFSSRIPIPRALPLGCTLADVDADGDLDAVIAVYSEKSGDHLLPGRGRVYLNEDGTFSPNPAWTTVEHIGAVGVTAADINQDGWMDLAFSADRPIVYYGQPWGLGGIANWIGGLARPFPVCPTGALVRAAHLAIRACAGNQAPLRRSQRRRLPGPGGKPVGSCDPDRSRGPPPVLPGRRAGIRRQAVLGDHREGGGARARSRRSLPQERGGEDTGLPGESAGGGPDPATPDGHGPGCHKKRSIPALRLGSRGQLDFPGDTSLRRGFRGGRVQVFPQIGRRRIHLESPAGQPDLSEPISLITLYQPSERRQDMLYLLADYSRNSELRDDFERDPAKVFDQYSVSKSDRALLKRYDREAIAARLHQEIDEALDKAGPDGWTFMYPVILGDPQPSEGPVTRRLEIHIHAKDLRKKISVKFFNAADQVTAKVKDVTHHPDGSSTIRCTAKFVNTGTYSLVVTNYFDGYKYPTSRPDCFTAAKAT